MAGTYRSRRSQARDHVEELDDREALTEHRGGALGTTHDEPLADPLVKCAFCDARVPESEVRYNDIRNPHCPACWEQRGTVDGPPGPPKCFICDDSLGYQWRRLASVTAEVGGATVKRIELNHVICLACAAKVRFATNVVCEASEEAML